MATDSSLPPVEMGADRLVLVKGAGDLASGVALRLRRCGFPVVMTERKHPLSVRRTVAFAQAVFAGSTTVEGIEAVCSTPQMVIHYLEQGKIPVVVDASARVTTLLHPPILVDAIMAKTNTGTHIEDAALVITLGPGFVAGQDCHAVVETNRSHYLGRVIWRGSAQPDTGVPGTLPGASYQAGRVLRAPESGTVHAHYSIGSRIQRGAAVATLRAHRGANRLIIAPFSGILRGIVHFSVPVTAGTKIGDLDSRARPDYCFTVSDKSLAVAGGVLEAILSASRVNDGPERSCANASSDSR